MGGDAVGGARRGLPAGRRPAGRPVARHAQRRHHAGPVEDRLPGRDRRGLRADRLLALQPDLHAADPDASSRSRARACGTGSSTGRWRASCSRSRRSTSPRSPATCRPRRRMMGNTVVLKPASTAVYSTLLPDGAARGGGAAAGVINLVLGLRRRPSATPRSTTPTWPASTSPARPACSSRCGGRSARTSHRYRGYPRIVGETGGKDFIVAHPSADPDAVATAIVRGAFEYQGQKCSAASRVYVPARTCGRRSASGSQQEVAEIQHRRRPRLPQLHGRGDRRQRPTSTQADAIEQARGSDDAEVVAGGETDDEQGWFVEPTVVQTEDPGFDLMQRELFGPVVTAYVYDEKRLRRRARARRRDVAVRADRRGLRDRPARPIEQARRALRNAAGNFYVNDKPTGAVVGPAAVRRRPRVGHQRQGRLDVEPDPLGQPAHDQGDVRAADATTATRSWRRSKVDAEAAQALQSLIGKGSVRARQPGGRRALVQGAAGGGGDRPRSVAAPEDGGHRPADAAVRGRRRPVDRVLRPDRGRVPQLRGGARRARGDGGESGTAPAASLPVSPCTRPGR